MTHDERRARAIAVIRHGVPLDRLAQWIADDVRDLARSIRQSDDAAGFVWASKPALQIPLAVLCAIASYTTLDTNMRNDVDTAIEGLRSALGIAAATGGDDAE